MIVSIHGVTSEVKQPGACSKYRENCVRRHIDARQDFVIRGGGLLGFQGGARQGERLLVERCHVNGLTRGAGPRKSPRSRDARAPITAPSPSRRSPEHQSGRAGPRDSVSCRRGARHSQVAEQRLGASAPNG